MKYLILLTIPLFLVACFENEEEETTENPERNLIHNSDLPERKPVYGVIASFDNTKIYDMQPKGIPLYASAESDEVVDSMYYLKHLGRYDGFYYAGEQAVILGADGAPITEKDYSNEDLYMPEKGDYFNYYHEEWMHQSLVFTDQIDNRFLVFSNTLDEGLWMDISDLPEVFEAYLWADFFDTLNYEGIDIIPVHKHLSFYSDTSFENKIGDIKLKNEAYYEILDHDSIYFKVARHQLANWEYSEDWDDTPWLYKAIEEEEIDTGWIQLVYNGIPQVQLDNNPYNTFNSRLGIGILVCNSQQRRFYTGRNRGSFDDSLKLYDHPDGSIVGYCPMNEGRMNTYHLSATKSDYEENPYGSDMDRFYTLSGEWDSDRVYDKGEGHVKMFQAKYKGKPSWIDRRKIKETYNYYSWKQFYLANLSGDDSWQVGYSWVGGNEYLYEKPNEKSKRLVEFPAQGAFFLTGKSKGSWAQVKFKEITYMPGCGEIHEHDEHYRWYTWQGWVKVVSKDGHPNLEGIVLGC